MYYWVLSTTYMYYCIFADDISCNFESGVCSWQTTGSVAHQGGDLYGDLNWRVHNRLLAPIGPFRDHSSTDGGKQLYTVTWSIPSKHKTFVWHLYNVGPTSKTLGRRCINVIQMFCVSWEPSKHKTFAWHLYSVALSWRCTNVIQICRFWAKRDCSYCAYWFPRFCETDLIYISTLKKQYSFFQNIFLPGEKLCENYWIAFFSSKL